jgi:PAS domain S-box-containing protein
MSKNSATYLVRSLVLVLAAIGVNIALGHLVQYTLQWPLFLDSIGTILVGALLGPLAGAATGAVSNLLWGGLLGDTSIVPYSITAAFIGWAAGYAASRGAFERFHTVLLSGLLVGVAAALISAPITAYLFGGVTGGGTDYLTSYLTATGANVLQAATIQGFISDPLDKMISFVLAWPLWRILHPYFLPPSQRGAWSFESLAGYSVAVVISLLALLLSFVFLPAFERGIFAVFYLAVLLSAWRGGLGPAIFTTAVGALANILFLVSPYFNVGVSAEDWLRVGVFTIVSLSIAVIADQLEKRKRDLQASLQGERESRARIRAITDGVNEALILVAPDQHILDTNRRFGELFGAPADRIVGQRLGDIRTLFDQVFAEAEQLYELALATSADEERDRERLIVQNWPQARELQLYSTPVRDQGVFLGRLFVFRDVTHEREVDRMKTEFVSLVSHELRTPLTSIKGFTAMVLDGDAGEINEEVEEYLGIVFSNAERLVSLVNDLLDLSRVESGRIQLKSEPVDLNEIVHTVVATMQQTIKEKGQSLSVSVDPAATNVVGDRDKMVQVLTNYVSNAYKYTQAGGDIRVEITSQGELARVAVSDNGFGIAPEDQEQLFTRFYRVDNSMTREIGGTGLGLSIVKQLIELMGGQVSVESALGSGSTFAFTVPLAAEAVQVAETAGVVEAAAVLPSEMAQPGASILVVEDDPDIARLIAHHLQKAGYRVQVAHTAEEALAGLAEDLPKLITLDIDLPGMQGDELARRLQADPLTHDIPVLILSVFVDEPGGMQLGAFALSKPIDQEELLATVARMLQGPEQGPVLVIDDDPGVRRLLEAALEKQGFPVETAGDGESGLALAGEHHPGLILLDLSMPGMDGYTVLQALKDNQPTAEIPVIAMTGSPGLKATARARVLALGASDLVTKPFDLSMLVEEVKLFLDAR